MEFMLYTMYGALAYAGLVIVAAYVAQKFNR